jgi:demethylmenaquinone methyltransferase / 2-methoxy-6-polyprenyl-1,4-benzoquinol methylase
MSAKNHNTIVPYSDLKESKKTQVSTMFDTISSEYDKLNRLITFGIDKSWRKKLVKTIVKLQPEKVLDVATGTGDLAIAIATKCNAHIIGLDISAGMLEVGKQKILDRTLQTQIEMVIGDSEHIGYPDNHFDAVTVAFGVRNFENLEAGLSEIVRVLKPGGTLAVLETSMPTNPILKFIYQIHGRIVLPLFGKLFSRDQRAYRYLADSAEAFPYNEKFVNILLHSGFSKALYHPQTFGAACIYYAKK